jgi:dTDP-4-dehydrorhamnose 3,5-epimerase
MDDYRQVRGGFPNASVAAVEIQPFEIAGAWRLTPKQFGDDRGTFLEWFRIDLLEAATGRVFNARQANHSISKRGTLRGIHFADVPPGQAKLVYCARGEVLDVVIDIRVGSPTFGVWQAMQLDDVDRRGVFISEGLGHAFVALTDDASVVYLTSTTYNPGAEREVNPLDSTIGIDWGLDESELSLSPKDAAAPSLAEAEQRGMLPSYDECMRLN